MKPLNLDNLLKRIEVKYTTRALQVTNGNTTEAARLIGVNRTTLIERLKRLKLEVDRAKPIGVYTKYIEFGDKIIDKTKLDKDMLAAYNKFSGMSKQQKVDIVMPLEEMELEDITNSRIETRFEYLIHSQYKLSLMKKLEKV